jgi:hypothetical protein
MLHCVVSQNFTDVSEVLTASIIRAFALRLHGSASQKTVIFIFATVRA